MALHVVEPGLQTMVQAGPRLGWRAWGVPMSGPADPISHALANRLLGNPLMAASLEIAYGPVAFVLEAEAAVAVAGAAATFRVNGHEAPMHRTCRLAAGDHIQIGAAEAGARMTLAVAGGVIADVALGSSSTYAPAGLGGYRGRALQAGDVLPLHSATSSPPSTETPNDQRPAMSRQWAMRTCVGPEFEALADDARAALFDTDHVVSGRCDRMGVVLDAPLGVAGEGRMPSAPVFPGVIQCPPNGRPVILGVDGQTTGGYPRIAQIIRADRHLIGQLRPGDRVRFLRRTPNEARRILLAKRAHLADWLPEPPI